MYEAYWGLREKPFQNTPDPRFFYHSSEHEEALHRLQYTISEGLGTALLSGVFGCGKTMVLYTLLDGLPDLKYKVALITNPRLGPTELLREIVYNLGVKDNLPHEKTDILHILREILLDNFNDGKKTVIIVDEVHVIEDRQVFEELRLLLNYQEKGSFLLTLILSGQPEIRHRISNLKQFSQRISIRYHLDRFGREDTEEYISHRIHTAGGKNSIFSPRALDSIYNQTGGIPRRINNLGELCLLTGYGMGAERIDENIVDEAGKDMEE